MKKAKLSLALLALASLSLVLLACQAVGQAKSGLPAPAQPPASTPPAPVKYVGEFSLSPIHAPAGAAVQATGSGFDPNIDLDLVWQRFRGSWKTTADGSFMGREFKDELQPLTTVKTDAAGRFQTTFVVPQGFGFSHDVVVQNRGVVQNKAGFAVDMQVSISASSGPVGTPIAIDARGIGWRPLENSWMLTYDNKFTGWLSAVTTDGAAHAVIPATGTPGKHIIQIIHGSYTFPYMNMQQSPAPDRPQWTFEFTITGGAAVLLLPPPAQQQSLPVVAGKTPAGSGPVLWTDVASGTVGTPFTLRGSGLPTGQQVEFLWFRVKGNRVSGQGWEESYTSLGTVTVGADGSIALPLKALDDLGGPHRIEARSGGQKLAETSFTITPSAFAIEPSSGPAGTTITIHLKGVGWTETANIYNLVYDNAYLGYACGFNSQGDVTVYLPAAGEPGWHFIDLYPGIYKGQDMKEVNDFRIPQLTSKDDHPGERLPAFHFAFQVTPEVK